MRFFNVLQFIVLFIAMPQILEWITKAQFAYANAAFYGLWVLYAIMIVFLFVVLLQWAYETKW